MTVKCWHVAGFVGAVWCGVGVVGAGQVGGSGAVGGGWQVGGDRGRCPARGVKTWKFTGATYAIQYAYVTALRRYASHVKFTDGCFGRMIALVRIKGTTRQRGLKLMGVLGESENDNVGKNKGGDTTTRTEWVFSSLNWPLIKHPPAKYKAVPN